MAAEDSHTLVMTESKARRVHLPFWLYLFPQLPRDLDDVQTGWASDVAARQQSAVEVRGEP